LESTYFLAGKQAEKDGLAGSRVFEYEESLCYILVVTIFHPEKDSFYG
jgi:hypothetical protein